MIKKAVKKVTKHLRNVFSKKIPINIPVYYGNLLAGRTALITGGNSGIGFAIAKNFVQNGANVIIIGRDEDKLKKCTNEINELQSGKCNYYVLDISNTDKIDESLKKITDNYKIDILVNNAGILSKGDITNTTIDDFERVIKTNLEGTFFTSQYFANYMKKNRIKGNILNVSSSSSLRPGITSYTISKWGVKSLTLGMAKKFIKDGIVVNAVAPGPTATPMFISSEIKDVSLKSNPSGRYATSEEIANIATVLVSDMGRMIVGDTVYVTGGAGLITYEDMRY